MIRCMTYRIKYSYYIFIYIICIFVIDQTVRLYNAFSIDTCTFIVKTYKIVFTRKIKWKKVYHKIFRLILKHKSEKSSENY